MKRLVLCLGAVLAACAPAGDPPAVVPYVPMDPAPPVYALLGHRARLDLTSEQVGALDSIGQWVDTENSALTEQLRELRGGQPPQPRGVGGRDGWPIATEETRSLLLQIGENNRRAAEGVRTVLSPAQQQITCELFRESGERRMREERAARSRARQTRGRRRAAEMEADSILRASAHPWRWCSRPAAGAAPDTIPGDG